jgi:hypothetical protein
VKVILEDKDTDPITYVRISSPMSGSGPQRPVPAPLRPDLYLPHPNPGPLRPDPSPLHPDPVPHAWIRSPTFRSYPLRTDQIPKLLRCYL